MTNTSFTLLNKIDDHKIECLKNLQAEAATFGLKILLVGATARDLYFTGGRRTEDVDIGLVVNNWGAYEKLKQQLIESGEFNPDPKRTHRLLYKDRLRVDIIPFDGVETAEGKIVWPDATGTMIVSGFKDVYAHAFTDDMGAGREIRIATIAGMTILKIIAWNDRHNEFPTKDAEDLALILYNYAEAGNIDRLYADHPGFVTDVDGDIELAGARLLGHDMAVVMSEPTRQLVQSILDHNTVPLQSDKLVETVSRFIPGGGYERALKILKSLQEGFGDIR